jgi:hypothetical protein
VPNEPSRLPAMSTCLACHDTQEALEHARNFAPPVAPTERCVECHRDGTVAAVSRVHPIGFESPIR